MIVRPLTARTLQYMDPLAHGVDMRDEDLIGYAAYEYGRLLGIGGLWTAEAAPRLLLSEVEDAAVGFLGIHPRGRGKPKTLWRMAVSFVDRHVDPLPMPVYALAEKSIPSATRFLDRLGFEPTGEQSPRYVEYRWPR